MVDQDYNPCTGLQGSICNTMNYISSSIQGNRYFRCIMYLIIIVSRSISYSSQGSYSAPTNQSLHCSNHETNNGLAKIPCSHHGTTLLIPKSIHSFNNKMCCFIQGAPTAPTMEHTILIKVYTCTYMNRYGFHQYNYMYNASRKDGNILNL